MVIPGYFLYAVFLKLYPLGIRIASIWNQKAVLWIRGRRNIFKTIGQSFKKKQGPVVWMHCASLGEFEQGRPLLEKLRMDHPGVVTVITFFSPSGYEVMKNYSGADHIYYLPSDSAEHAKKFISIINPDLVLWVKYEYWYHYLNELNNKNIPVLLVSGAFREDQPFFKWYGGFWRKMLSFFTWYFVQNQSSKELLENAGISNVSISGDTRFDRVIKIAEDQDGIKWMNEFCNGNKVVVAGSTWEDDEAELVHFARSNKQIKFVIAPHEIDKENLRDVKKEFTGSLFYSELNAENINSTNIIIIDNVGMLSRLYRYATITYVGGGFGYDGLHNILEPAVYGKPVLFGPETDRNFEATELVECGGGFIIKNALEVEKVLAELFSDHEKLSRAGEAAKQYVYTNAGASQAISDFIQEKRLLTS